jgi:hypothetical protein
MILLQQCDYPYHPACVGLSGVPDGEWFCPVCVDAPEAPLGAPRPKRGKGGQKKRGREEGVEDEGKGKGAGEASWLLPCTLWPNAFVALSRYEAQEVVVKTRISVGCSLDSMKLGL